jgi:hypothetical protein
MSERLDRLEKIVESNSRAIKTWANESVDFRNRMEATTSRIVDSIELLTQVAVRLDARQQDQENRVNRLEDHQ